LALLREGCIDFAARKMRQVILQDAIISRNEAKALATLEDKK
jgi:hypothetical protein